MQETCSKASSLIPVIDVEVAETDTSFLAVPDTYLKSVLSYCSCNT